MNQRVPVDKRKGETEKKAFRMAFQLLQIPV